MSDSVLRLIPRDPDYQPPEEVDTPSVALLKRAVPGSSHVAVRFPNRIFVDPGSNLESIGCPECGEEIDPLWWAEAMAKAALSMFANLDFTMPCCGALVSLNDLGYVNEAGFARYGLTAFNPTGELRELDLLRLERLVGSRLRVIRAHY